MAVTAYFLLSTVLRHNFSTDPEARISLIFLPAFEFFNDAVSYYLKHL